MSASGPGPSGELDVIRSRARRSWDWLEETVADVTTEMANWWPGGTANSIGAVYLHLVINADVELHRLAVGRTPLVEGDWRGDVGQGLPYDPDRFDIWARHQSVDWDRLRAYGQAVHPAVITVLEQLAPAELDAPVDMSRAGLGTWQVRDLCHLHGVEHVRIHGGEIACLKGIQGGTGWPEPEAFRAAIEVVDVEVDGGLGPTAARRPGSSPTA